MTIKDLPLSELTAELDRHVKTLNAARMKGLDRGESPDAWTTECWAANQLRRAQESCWQANRKLTPPKPKPAPLPLSELTAEMERRIETLDRGNGVERYAANKLRTAVEFIGKAEQKLADAPPKTGG